MKYRFVAIPVFVAEMILSPTLAARAESGHAAYVEAAGSGVIATANYEWQPTHSLVLRLGIGAMPRDGNDAHVVVPIGGAGLIPMASESVHHLELGGSFGILPINFGGTPRHSPFPSPSVYLVPLAGYRYQPEKSGASGLLIRATVTPLITLANGPDFHMWAGISVGYLFR